MPLLLAAMLLAEPPPAAHRAAERARAAVIATCRIAPDRLAIEQDPGSILYSVALKGSDKLSDGQIDCFGDVIARSSAAVALSIEDAGISARYDALARRSALTTARAVLRHEGLLHRLPVFDRRRETLAAFAVRLERLCGVAPRSLLRATGRRLTLRDDDRPAKGRRAAREFCAINAAIAAGRDPLYVPVIPLPQIDPPPVYLPAPSIAATTGEKQPK